MGWQIIKQPNGRYAVWSTIVDDIIAYDGTKQEIVNLFVKDVVENTTKDVTRMIDRLEEGDKPYYQFTKTWPEVLADRRIAHPEAKPLKLRK